ncbi:MAG TPA: hypothetical protein VKU00_28325 [Chthonomonadaceae bacterium]|nr:hypothetical protein [Chthonomonadaceae bacterium]
MKLWVWGVLGLLVVAVYVLFVLYRLYRAFSIKAVSPSRSPLAQAVFDADTARARTLLDQGADANSTMSMTYRIAPGGNISASFRVPISGGGGPPKTAGAKE